MEYKLLNNGIKIPVLGFGTARMQGEECYKSVSEALECGYRLIDTAQMYENHRDIARALQTSQIPREELFVMSKISHNFNFLQTKEQIYRILEELSLGYLDLLLIHEPYSNSLEIYEAMQEAYESGLVKSLGVSNFNEKFLFKFMQKVAIKPVLNQCETHLLYQQKSLRIMLLKHDIFLQSWSPFIANQNGILKHSLLMELAKKYSKTPAQIILNFFHRLGILLIPKSSNLQRMKENLEVFDFGLEDGDLQKLKNLDTGKSFFGWYE